MHNIADHIAPLPLPGLITSGQCTCSALTSRRTPSGRFQCLPCSQAIPTESADSTARTERNPNDPDTTKPYALADEVAHG